MRILGPIVHSHANMASCQRLRAEGYSILEVGTGLGYQAAVLAELSGRVWSVEIVEELAGQAEANLRQLGCSDVAIRIGDGSRGWREHAPYDRALLTAAAERLPPAILDQIKPG